MLSQEKLLNLSSEYSAERQYKLINVTRIPSFPQDTSLSYIDIPMTISHKLSISLAYALTRKKRYRI